MGIDEWSATQGLVLWPLLNVVTWIQMLHGHRWMKCCPGTSSMVITECCDWETDVPWASMNEVLPRDQFYGHYWMLWLGDRCSMGIEEWSSTQGPVLYGHHWVLWLGRDQSYMAITECCDWDTDVPYEHRWMKYYPGTPARDHPNGQYWMLWLKDRNKNPT
jgi:hypothetical protein